MPLKTAMHYLEGSWFWQVTQYTPLDKFNDWGWRGSNIFVPVLRGNGTKMAPTGDRFDQPTGQMR